MARGVVEFCKNLTSMIAPMLDAKDKENRKLKRMLHDRIKTGGKTGFMHSSPSLSAESDLED
jgi:hypothetical protein